MEKCRFRPIQVKIFLQAMIRREIEREMKIRILSVSRFSLASIIWHSRPGVIENTLTFLNSLLPLGSSVKFKLVGAWGHGLLMSYSR